MSRSRRYQKLIQNINPQKEYALEEAIDLVKTTAKAKFDESLEVHIKLGIDPKKDRQQVKGITILPYGTGKVKKMIVFAEGDEAIEAKKAKADLIGGKELIEKIKQGQGLNFDVAITTPSMMPKLATIAKILGPRGLMPSPKNETLTSNITKTIEELRKGKVTFKNDDTGNVHQVIGKISWDKSKVLENLKVFMEAVKKAKPTTSKGIYLKNITLTSTMGPGVKIKY